MHFIFVNMWMIAIKITKLNQTILFYIKMISTKTVKGKIKTFLLNLTTQSNENPYILVQVCE